MRHWINAAGAVFVLVVVSGSVSAAPVTGTVRAGRDARAVCTLPGVPLAGYGGAERRKLIPLPEGYTFFFQPSEGVADAVRVKTVVIEDDGQLLAFVGLDAIGVSVNIVDEVTSRLSGTGLNRHNMMFMGTHTHAGPGAVVDKIFWQVGAADAYNNDVFDHVVANITASVQAALADLQPATLGVGAVDAPGLSKNRRHEGAPVNTELGVIKLETLAGDPLAIVFNFAVHPTSLGSSNMLLSADNVGYAERYLESNLSGAVALFANGAEGDVKPLNGGGWTGAQTVGEGLGAAALNLWSSITNDAQATLEINTVQASTPPFELNVASCEETLTQLIQTWMISLPGEMAETSALFMAVRLNDSAFVTVPGEPITAVGALIRDPVVNAGFANAFVVGLANGYMGYVVTPEEYDLGGYESCGTLHGRETSVFVVERALSAALGLTPPGSSSGDPDAGVVAQVDAGVPVGQDAASNAGNDAGVGTAPDAGGCGCTAGNNNANSAWILILAGLLGLRRRRRDRL